MGPLKGPVVRPKIEETGKVLDRSLPVVDSGFFCRPAAAASAEAAAQETAASAEAAAGERHWTNHLAAITATCADATAAHKCARDREAATDDALAAARTAEERKAAEVAAP